MYLSGPSFELCHDRPQVYTEPIEDRMRAYIFAYPNGIIGKMKKKGVFYFVPPPEQKKKKKDKTPHKTDKTPVAGFGGTIAPS